MKLIIIFCTIFVHFINGDNEARSKLLLNQLHDNLTNISFEDVLSFGIEDRNEDIRKKIIDVPADFITDHVRDYSSIRLKLNTQNLARGKSISVDLTSAKASFHNIKIVENYGRYDSRVYYSLSTEIQCDPLKNITTDVTLPTEVNITADVTITHTLGNSTSEGTFSATIVNGNIRKYFNIFGNDIRSIDAPSKISYDSPSIQFRVDKKSENLLSSKSETILDEFTTFLGPLFDQQLNEEIAKNKKSLILFCSKIVNVEQGNTSHSSDIFVISNPTSDIWNSINLTIGPIIIDGLTNFITTKLSVLQMVHELNSDYNDKKSSIRFKTDVLKGKFKWTYNLEEENETRTFIYSFSTNGVEFEAPSYRNSGGCGVGWNTHVGQIRIESSRAENWCDENRIIEGVISENLRIIITNSLHSTLKIDWRLRNLAGYGCGYY